MANYFLTYSGKRFDVDNFSVDNIDSEDIAHALSLLCRGNGHYKQFYSVAQHSLNCYREARARSYSENLCLACLLHDASEAYLSDLISDIKKKIPEYLTIEDMLISLVYKKYSIGVGDDERKLIKSVDTDVLWYEFESFHSKPYWMNEPQIFARLDLCTRPINEVEKELLTELKKAERRCL